MHTIVDHDVKALNKQALESLEADSFSLRKTNQCPLCGGKLSVARCGLGEKIVSAKTLTEQMLADKFQSSDEQFLCAGCNILWKIESHLSSQIEMPGHETQPGSTTIYLVGKNNCYCRSSIWKGTSKIFFDGPRGLAIYHKVHQIFKGLEKSRGGFIPNGIRLKDAVIGG